MNDGSVLVVPRQPVVVVSPSAAYSTPAMGIPTPSPFSFSVASTRWSSSRPYNHVFGLVLRAMMMAFSFGSSLALAVTMSNNNQQDHDKQGFQHHPELVLHWAGGLQVVEGIKLVEAILELRPLLEGLKRLPLPLPLKVLILDPNSLGHVQKEVVIQLRLVVYCYSYNLIITTAVFIYSIYQLFKGIFDIADKGILISDKTSDYTSFILDQLAGYLLVSCSAVTAVMINQEPLSGNTSLKRAATASVCLSVAAFLTTAICAILSGYKLSKRVIW